MIIITFAKKLKQILTKLMKVIVESSIFRNEEGEMTRSGHQEGIGRVISDGNRQSDRFMARLVNLLKRRIRLKIASEYRGADVSILNRCAEWVFDAPVWRWRFRLKILLKCVVRPSVGLLEERSAFVVGNSQELVH